MVTKGMGMAHSDQMVMAIVIVIVTVMGMVMVSGSIFLFNKKSVRGFRKDGHEWKKKKDGKNVMEHHEKYAD